MWLAQLPILIATVLCLTSVKTQDYRLPNIYVPNHYQVNLNVSANAFTASGTEFNGIVTINFTVTEDTNDIKLHVSHYDLNVNAVIVSGHNIDVLDYKIDDENDILTITYPVGLTAGRPYLLTIDFSGNLSDDEDGFYKSSYTDDLGVTRYLAATQFETTSARRAFPCFDEPALKATFDISITYPLGYHAISNTPGNIVSNDSDTETIQFEITPKMSTYLIAFVVSDFTSVGTVAEDGVVHQVWSRNNTSNARDWALEIGPKALAALANFTGYSYSKVMKKMDQGAIPDFGGAMENWGLVLYEEGYLLWDKETGSNSDKQTVAMVITHEFSHQWFGDLVTLNWWSVTFLNEGFATYCESNIVHEFLPDWRMDLQFVVDVVQPIMVSDSYQSSLALESPATTEQEIHRKFDGISYNKGGGIIRMVEHILGRQSFRTGIHNYIEEYKFSNAISENLWNALNEEVDNSVAKLPDELGVVMKNWTVKAGYPILQVSRNGSELTISQERFLLKSTEDEGTKWYVPISYTTSLDDDKFVQTSPSAWLTPESDLTIEIPSEASWVILNNQLSGYYRVNYDEGLWESIGAALLKEDFDGIGELNRAQIIDDLFNLFQANKVEVSSLLSFVKFLANDTSYITWVTAFKDFSSLLSAVGRDNDLAQKISAEILELSTALYESAPADKPNSDDQIYTLKRVLASNWACRLGNQDCIDYSLAKFASYKNNGTQLDNNLKYVICCNGLRYSTDPSDLEFMEQVFKNATPSEQWYLYDVLSCSNSQKAIGILERHLSKMIDEEESRSTLRVVESALSALYKNNPESVDLVLEFLINNYEAIAKRYKSPIAPENMLKSIATKLSSPDHITKFKKIMERRGVSDEFVSALEAAVEIVEINVEWIREAEVKLRNYYKLK